MSYVIQHISKMDYLEVYDNGDDKMSMRWESNVDCATHFRTRSEAESVMAEVLAICTVITVHAARNSKEYKQKITAALMAIRYFSGAMHRPEKALVAVIC